MPFSLRALISFLWYLLSGLPVVFAQPTHSAKVGVLLPLSGDFRSVGELARKTLEGQELNNLKLRFEDSACNARKALDAYRKLSASDGVRLFLGPCCGNELESIVPLISTKDELMIPLCSSSSEVYTRSNGKLLSSAFSVEAESEFMAKQIEARGIRKIAIIYFNNSFSEAHDRAFRKAMKLSEVSTITFDTMDPEAIRTIVLRLRKDPPAAIYVPDLTPFLLTFAKQLRTMGLASTPIFSIHAVQTPDLLKSEGAAANGIIYSHPDTGGEAVDGYFPRVAATMLDKAVARCGENVACIKRELLSQHSFNSDGTLQTTIVLRTIKEGKFVPVEPTR